MTDQEIEKLQRGIEAALRDINALNFGATVVEQNNSATVLVRPKPGYDVESQRQEQQRVADELRIALMGRGYDVTSEVVSPASDDEFYSFTVYGHTSAPARS